MSPDKKSLLSLLTYGSIFICTGTVIFLIATGVIPISDQNVDANKWVLSAAGIALALVGSLVIVQGLKARLGDHPLLKWIFNSTLLAFAILFALPYHWYAFTRTAGVERLAYGFAALLLDVVVVILVVKILQGRDLERG